MVDDTSQRAGTWCFMADSPATTAKTALCARSRAELVVSRGRLSLVVYLTGTLSSYKRALPAVLNVSSNPQYWGTASYHRHAGAVSGHSTTADYDLPSAPTMCAFMKMNGLVTRTLDVMRAAVSMRAGDAGACRDGQQGPRRSHTVHSRRCLRRGPSGRPPSAHLVG